MIATATPVAHTNRMVRAVRVLAHAGGPPALRFFLPSEIWNYIGSQSPLAIKLINVPAQAVAPPECQLFVRGESPRERQGVLRRSRKPWHDQHASEFAVPLWDLLASGDRGASGRSAYVRSRAGFSHAFRGFDEGTTEP
jgi:hypothetical protein